MQKELDNRAAGQLKELLPGETDPRTAEAARPITAEANNAPLTGKITVDSTSDERTANNVVRHEYRVLNDWEKAKMKSIKDIGAALIEEINSLSAHVPNDPISREMQIAQQKAEEAVMWAVKHITK